MGLLNDDFSDEGSGDDPDADKRSNDSVDQLWQAVLNNKHDQYMTELESHRGDEPYEQFEPVEESNTDQIADVTIAEPNIQLQEAQIIDIKKQEEEKYQKMMEELISFQFPSTAEYNQHNIDLHNYEKYFTDQLHLAPSTDSRTLRIMNHRKHATGSAA